MAFEALHVICIHSINSYVRCHLSLHSFSAPLRLFSIYHPCITTPVTWSLDALAEELGITRRRLYDILHVLHAIGIALPQCKNTYIYYGFLHVREALDHLRSAANADGRAFAGSDLTGISDFLPASQQLPLVPLRRTAEKHFARDADGKLQLSSPKPKYSKQNAADPPSSTDISLRHLTQLYVQLFLSDQATNRIVTMVDAVDALIPIDGATSEDVKMQQSQSRAGATLLAKRCTVSAALRDNG